MLKDIQTILDEERVRLHSEMEPYVPRTLVQEGISQSEATQLRQLSRLIGTDSKGKVLHDYDLLDFHRVAVIGNAGSGKSHSLMYLYLCSISNYLEAPNTPLPLFLDLDKHLSTRRSIENVLDRRYQGHFDKACTDGAAGCILFLDALDQRLLSEANSWDFINDVRNFLTDHDRYLRGVILACRRPSWNPQWFLDWPVYHTDYLDEEDYSYLLPDREQRQQFFEDAADLGILNLLAVPFFGYDLARQYSQGHQLPSSRQVWFEQRIEEALKGSKQDRERHQSAPLDLLNFLVRQLACLATFGNSSGWTAQKAFDYLNSSEVVRREFGTFSYEQVQALLSRPLFSKSDGLFSFAHQLLREYLAAGALQALPLRKQRQLLESTSVHAQHRISAQHRGVAIFLAELSPQFCKHLIENDPMVAFLAELPNLPSGEREKLLTHVIDKAILEHRAPWWGVPPRGERPRDALAKFQPGNPTCFLRSYLDSTNEMSLLWATACADAWGGVEALNDLLIKVAHDEKIHNQARVDAVDAVLASDNKESIQQLYALLECRDDEVRGHALHAYRITEQPPPDKFFVKLRGGSRRDDLLCLLQLECSAYGRSLDAQDLEKAFEELPLHLRELGNLRAYLLSGLFERACELKYFEISPQLLVQLWMDNDVRQNHYVGSLEKLIRSNPDLFKRVWNYILHELGRGTTPVLHRADLGQHLARVCNDQIFDLLPPDGSTLTRQQEFIILGLLRSYFQSDPTLERFLEFKKRAPELTSHWQISRFAADRQSRDPLTSRQEVVNVLERQEFASWQKAFHILHIVERWLPNPKDGLPASTDVLTFMRSTLSAPLRQRVLAAFHESVEQLCFIREQKKSSGQFTMTHLDYEIPFWILWDLGTVFSVEKIEEFIRCYAFSDVSNPPNRERYHELLDWLCNEDDERWNRCLNHLLELPAVGVYGPLEYLMSRNSDLYLDKCRQRLLRGEFRDHDFNVLLKYFIHCEPSDLNNVLQTCYEKLDRTDHKMQVLYVLLGQDNDWAWQELARLIDTGELPTEIYDGHLDKLFRTPPATSRLPLLADWYALLRRHYAGADEVRLRELPRLLEEVIAQIGGDKAISELKRLQTQKAFPNAEWLSYLVLRIEDDMLSTGSMLASPSQLLDFVNRETLGVVLNENHLFEWVCQAVEDVKEGIEKRGEQVYGYWHRTKHRSQRDDWQPADETECQNVLWPAIKGRLSNLGVTNVEERVIRADRVDFWVEKPVPSKDPLRVLIELKVARKDYGARQLLDPIHTQLWEKYLQPTHCKHGIYIVLWFKDSDRYPYPTEWLSRQDLEMEIENLKCQVMERHSVTLACYVIDMTAPARLH